MERFAGVLRTKLAPTKHEAHLKLTLAIAFGIVLVLTLSAWLRIRADADAYHRDTLRDHYVVGRGLATAVELLWSREGEARALELVRLVNDRENRIGIRWVWPDAASGEHAPRFPAVCAAGRSRAFQRSE